jgi:hypothetical protein
MSPRKPPRLATWLLHRLGLTRQNPPLIGDLLEEFRAGRSSAWFWRQTLIVILTGFASNARQLRRLLMTRLIGWVGAAGIAFLIWRRDLPPRVDLVIVLSLVAILLLPWLWLEMRGRRRLRRTDAERVEQWDQLDCDGRRIGRRILVSFFIGSWFITCLALFCVFAAICRALDHPLRPSDFIFFQAALLYTSVTDVFAPTKGPGVAVTLLTREKP